MKKDYIAPEMEVVLFETGDDVMEDIYDSDTDPFNSVTSPIRFQQYLNDLPNGTMLDEDGYEKR